MSQQETGTPQQIAAVIGEIAARGEKPTVDSVSAAVTGAPLGLIHQELQSWRSRQTAPPVGDRSAEAPLPGGPEGEVVELALPAAPETPEALVAAVDLIYTTMSSEIAAAEARGRDAVADRVRFAEREMTALRHETERALARADDRVRVAEDEAGKIAAENRRLAADNQQLSARITELEAARDQASEEYDTLMRDREALQAERDAMASALEEREQVTATAATAEKMAQEMPILEARIAALEAERDRLRNERNAARQAAIHAKGERDALKSMIGTAKFQRAPMRRR